DVADRRGPRAGGPAPAWRIFLEAEMAQSAAAAGSRRRCRQGSDYDLLGGMHRLPPRTLPRQRHDRTRRRPAARLSAEDYYGFSPWHARQQSRHVRSDEGNVTRRHRRARAISRWIANRRISRQPVSLLRRRKLLAQLRNRGKVRGALALLVAKALVCAPGN